MFFVFNMTEEVVEKMPLEILKKAVKLRDPLKEMYIALYSYGSASSSEIAKLTGHTRPYVSLRLNQLVDMGLVKRRQEGRKVKYEVVK